MFELKTCAGEESIFAPLTDDDVLGISAALGLTRKQGEMVALLIIKPVFTADMAENLLGLKSDFKVLICRLNKRLSRSHGVATQTHYSVGYSLGVDQREKLYTVLFERSGRKLNLFKLPIAA